MGINTFGNDLDLRQFPTLLPDFILIICNLRDRPDRCLWRKTHLLQRTCVCETLSAVEIDQPISDVQLPHKI